MARPANLNSEKLVLNMPARQKRKIVENARKAGVTASEYVQSLVDMQPEYTVSLSVDFLRELTAPLMDEFPQISKLWLFGSCARGTATPESDVDLAYELDHGHFRILTFYGRLSQLEKKLGRPIDDVNVTHPRDNEFYRDFDIEKVLLHERKSN